MKTLLVGFLAFAIWSILATHIYVCVILGLCNNQETPQNVEIILSDSIAVDSLQIAILQEEVPAPSNIVIYFKFDKSDFNPDASSEKYLEESKIYLEQNEQALLSIAGHTDAVGSDKYNMALGYRRAQRIQLYFENNGVLSSQMIIESYGEREPADDNSTAEGRANNRRTEITIKN